MRKFYTLLITITFAISANAQFSGDYAPINWTLTGTSANSDASVDTSGAPGSIVFNGNDSEFGDCCDLTDDYSITVATTGFISFLYDFSNPDIEEFYYVINGTATLIADANATGAINDIPVTAGDVFGFRIYTDDDCCGRGVSTISGFLFNTTLGTSENSLLNSDITIYPATTKGLYNLSYAGNSKLKQLNIFNVSGKLIKSFSLNSFSNTQSIDLTGLANGLYVVSIESEQSTVTKKLVI